MPESAKTFFAFTNLTLASKTLAMKKNLFIIVIKKKLFANLQNPPASQERQ